MTYRAYAMDPDGHYKGVHVLASCTTDEQALHAAEQYIDNGDIQVWNLRAARRNCLLRQQSYRLSAGVVGAPAALRCLPLSALLRLASALWPRLHSQLRF